MIRLNEICFSRFVVQRLGIELGPKSRTTGQRILGQVTQPAEGQTDGHETSFDNRRKGYAMLILIAKLLATISLPVQAKVLWKIRSRAAWPALSLP